MPSKPHEPISLIQMVLIMLGFKWSMILSFIKALIIEVCQWPETILEQHGFPHHPIAYEINHQLKGWVADCC